MLRTRQSGQGGGEGGAGVREVPGGRQLLVVHRVGSPLLSR
jgi:hypothetical protein